MRNVFDFFKRNRNSKEIAKNRLKLVLINDKGGYAPKMVDLLKEEILKALAPHMEYNEKEVDIKIIQKRETGIDDSVSTLVANIPILRLK